MKEHEIESKLKSILSKEFLSNLVEVGRLYGWSGDYCEIGDFIMQLHNIKGIDIKQEDIKPYD